jgi:NarL family two-component system response regulator LiaR
MSIRLYVAEDTEHVRKMLVDILGLHGFEVVGSAGSGEQTLEELERAEGTEPDVVVMDLKLPGMDGLEAARRIRELRPSQQIILYSAYVDDDVQRMAREAGVAVCVPKLSGVEALAREISAVAVDLGR